MFTPGARYDKEQIEHTIEEVERKFPAALAAIYAAITEWIRAGIKADDFQPHFAVRTVSEQKELRDSKWD